MPKINGNFQYIEVFQYVKSLNLNMGCYHIIVSEIPSNVCNIILFWVNYRHKIRLMGVRISLEIFQGEIKKYSVYSNVYVRILAIY